MAYRRDVSAPILVSRSFASSAPKNKAFLLLLQTDLITRHPSDMPWMHGVFTSSRFHSNKTDSICKGRTASVDGSLLDAVDSNYKDLKLASSRDAWEIEGEGCTWAFILQNPPTPDSAHLQDHIPLTCHLHVFFFSTNVQNGV